MNDQNQSDLVALEGRALTEPSGPEETVRMLSDSELILVSGGAAAMLEVYEARQILVDRVYRK